MPIFDFACPNCHTTFEKIVKSDVTMVECPKCDNLAKKQVSAPGGFVLVGGGFYKPNSTKE